jgi:O-antigen ligase
MNKHLGNIYNKLYLLLFGLLAFSIPLFDRIAATAIVLIMFTWIIEGKFSQKFQRIKRDKFRRYILLFGLIYLFYLAGFFYSKNQYHALLDLQTKLSLLIFPIIFSTLDYNVINWKKGKILYYYVIGCVVITAVLLGRSFINFLTSNSADEFFYGNLSWYHHASYLSMFLVFAVGILLYQIHTKTIFKNKSGLLFHTLIIYFSIFILMLSSKAGILSLVIIILSYVGVLLYKKQYLKGVAILVVLSVAIWGMFSLFSVTSSRISDAQQTISNETVEKGATDSTSERILIWQSAVSIIRENILFGVGTGDADDALLKTYKTNQYSGALENRLNAHNQYLQTFIAIGIIGFFVLIGVLFIPLYQALKHRNILYLLLLFLVTFNLLFESMLERQAGVVFYTFFNGLFFFYMFTEKQSD